MVAKIYKHIIAQPETHQRLKRYQVDNNLRSLDLAIENLLEVAKK